MLTHDNITWTAQNVSKLFQMKEGVEKVVSFLPLSHIAAQMSDLHGPLLIGGAVSCAQPDALKGTLGR